MDLKRTPARVSLSSSSGLPLPWREGAGEHQHPQGALAFFISWAIFTCQLWWPKTTFELEVYGSIRLSFASEQTSAETQLDWVTHVRIPDRNGFQHQDLHHKTLDCLFQQQIAHLASIAWSHVPSSAVNPLCRALCPCFKTIGRIVLLTGPIQSSRQAPRPQEKMHHQESNQGFPASKPKT